jgi:hypothetical protein
VFSEITTRDDKFKLSWKLTETMIDFSLRYVADAPVLPYWFGIGFNADTAHSVMAGTDFVVVMWTANGDCVASDRFAQAAGVPSVDSALGGKDDLVKQASRVRSYHHLLILGEHHGFGQDYLRVRVFTPVGHGRSI